MNDSVPAPHVGLQKYMCRMGGWMCGQRGEGSLCAFSCWGLGFVRTQSVHNA